MSALQSVFNRRRLQSSPPFVGEDEDTLARILRQITTDEPKPEAPTNQGFGRRLSDAVQMPGTPMWGDTLPVPETQSGVASEALRRILRDVQPTTEQPAPAVNSPARLSAVPDLKPVPHTIPRATDDDGGTLAEKYLRQGVPYDPNETPSPPVTPALRRRFSDPVSPIGNAITNDRGEVGAQMNANPDLPRDVPSYTGEAGVQPFGRRRIEDPLSFDINRREEMAREKPHMPRWKAALEGLGTGGIPSAIRGLIAPNRVAEDRQLGRLRQLDARIGQEAEIQKIQDAREDRPLVRAERLARIDALKQRPQREAEKALQSSVLRIYGKMRHYKRGENPQFDMDADRANLHLVEFDAPQGRPQHFYDGDGVLSTYDSNGDAIPVTRPDGQLVVNKAKANTVVNIGGQDFTVTQGAGANAVATAAAGNANRGVTVAEQSAADQDREDRNRRDWEDKEDRRVRQEKDDIYRRQTRATATYDKWSEAIAKAQAAGSQVNGSEDGIKAAREEKYWRERANALAKQLKSAHGDFYEAGEGQGGYWYVNEKELPQVKEAQPYPGSPSGSRTRQTPRVNVSARPAASSGLTEQAVRDEAKRRGLDPDEAVRRARANGDIQ